MFKQNYRSQVRNALLWCILETVIGGRWEQRKPGHGMMRSVDNRFAPASRLHWRLVDLCFWETDCSASSFHICGLLLVALHNSNVQDQIVSPFSKSLPSHRAVFCQAVSEGTIGAETSFRWWGSTWILSWTLLLENVSVLFVSSTLKYTWEKPVSQALGIYKTSGVSGTSENPLSWEVSSGFSCRKKEAYEVNAGFVDNWPLMALLSNKTEC